jgi:hypothetical protein
LCVFKDLNALSFRAFAACTLSTPKGLSSRPWRSLKSRRGDESCRRNHNSGRLADDPFPSISKGLSVAPPSSDVIRTSYPAFLQKGSFFQPSGFPRAIGDLSRRRWLAGQNPIDNYAGDRLSGRADIAAGTAGLYKNRTFRGGGTMGSSPWSKASGFEIRKLAAILAADIVGRLTGADNDRTLASRPRY